MENKTWHIVPENDSEPHSTVSAIKTIVDNDGVIGEIIECDCGCEPTIVDEYGVVKVVHNSFDGRPSAYFQNVNKEQEALKIEEKAIGILNKKWGLNGFHTAMPGHPVYDDGSRYAIYLEPEKGNIPYRATFYKETLKSWINFS